MSEPAERLLEIGRRLRDECGQLEFPASVAYVYNPLAYAWAPFEQYLRRYARHRPRAVLLGMNPGPFGMLQTGVPFGDVGMVRDWLGIDAPVAAPEHRHPKRPVEGFAIRRGEVSGRRVWGWARDRYGSPDAFFDRYFVINYCPLGFLDAGGANLTPDKFKGEVQRRLFEVCDRALADSLRVLAPEWVLGIGRFAEQRALAVAADLDLRVGVVTHPSPANPKAHGGWDRLMDAALLEYGLAVQDDAS